MTKTPPDGTVWSLGSLGIQALAKLSEWHPNGIRRVSGVYSQRFPAHPSAIAAFWGWFDGVADTPRQAEYSAVLLVWRPVFLPSTRLRKLLFRGAKRERRRATGPRGALLEVGVQLTCPAMTGSTAVDTSGFSTTPFLRSSNPAPISARLCE